MVADIKRNQGQQCKGVKELTNRMLHVSFKLIFHDIRALKGEIHIKKSATRHPLRWGNA